MIHYTVKANKPYLLATILVDMRIPFEFNPTKKYGIKKWKNGYNGSVFEIDLLKDGEGPNPDSREASLADIMYNISQRPNGTSFELTIISQYEY